MIWQVVFGLEHKSENKIQVKGMEAKTLALLNPCPFS
jgi:hypothetical protein